jgi:diacylglycerol kinase (ATP)
MKPSAQASNGPEAKPPARPRIIWNRRAGTKAGLPTNRIDETGLRLVLERHGLGDDIVAPQDVDEARAAVLAAIADGCRPIVAAGGDGTAYLVADELLGTDVPLGILPLGSAMNLARSLDIPRELDAAAAIVAAGNERIIDVGEADGRRFYEATSIGLGAQIFAKAHEFDKGRYRSVFDLIGVLRRARRTRIRLRLDGRPVEVKAIAVVVANAPFTGLGLNLAPDAALDDGCFDVRVFRRYSRTEFLRHFWSISFGRRAYAPKIAEYRATRVEVETAGLPCRADDFDLPRSPLDLVVRPGVLRVVAPPKPRLSAGRAAIGRSYPASSVGWTPATIRAQSWSMSASSIDWPRRIR